MPITIRPKKYFARYQEPLTEMPHLVESQIVSFADLIERGLPNLLKEFSPIKDYAEKKFELSFGKLEIARPKYDEHFAKDNKQNYEGQIKITVTLKNKTLNIIKEQEMFLADPCKLSTPMSTSASSFGASIERPGPKMTKRAWNST